MKLLLDAGADPNAGDLYTNPAQMARDKQLHSLQGKNMSVPFFLLLCFFPSSSSLSCLCLLFFTHLSPFFLTPPTPPVIYFFTLAREIRIILHPPASFLHTPQPPFSHTTYSSCYLLFHTCKRNRNNFTPSRLLLAPDAPSTHTQQGKNKLKGKLQAVSHAVCWIASRGDSLTTKSER